MPRPRLPRVVAGVPRAAYFKPQGLPLRDLTEVRLSVEGLEALRLADLEGLTTEEAARDMGVSRHTFGRVLAEARATVARALVTGAALRIEGGHYQVAGAAAPAAVAAAPLPSRPLAAIPATGPGLDAPVAPQAGRAAGFALVDLGGRTARFLATAPGRGVGAGPARGLIEAGVTVLLAGRLQGGLRNRLSAAGIRVVDGGDALAGLTVGEAADRLANGAFDADPAGAGPDNREFQGERRRQTPPSPPKIERST